MKKGTRAAGFSLVETMAATMVIFFCLVVSLQFLLVRAASILQLEQQAGADEAADAVLSSLATRSVFELPAQAAAAFDVTWSSRTIAVNTDCAAGGLCDCYAPGSGVVAWTNPCPAGYLLRRWRVQTTDAARNERQLTVVVMPQAAAAACISPGGGGGPCAPLLLRETKLIDPLVTQSSTYQAGGITFEARLAVDGDAGYSGDFWNGRSSSATNYEFQPWWQEDLGSVRAITSVTVYGRTDCCPEMSNNFYVLVSSSPIQSTTLSAALSEPGVWHSVLTSPGANNIATVSVGQAARYVRIWKSDTEWLVLAEVVVQ